VRQTIVAILFLVSYSFLASSVSAQVARSPELLQTIKSVYTDISTEKCKTIETDKETGDSVQSCSGIAGFSLYVEVSDDRMSVTIVAPDGKKHPLNYWDVITQSLSALGNKAEWRVVEEKGKLIPVALIVRVNASEDAEPRKVTSYLAVAKITEQEICVTDKIKPGKRANEEARGASDAAGSKSCLQQ
jgi:hypothetical protein